MRVAILAIALHAAACLKVTVIGPGDPWLSLCTAKVAASQGARAACVTKKTETAAKMLWGKDATGGDIDLVDGAANIGDALADATGLVINGAAFGGLKDTFALAALRNAPSLEGVVVCVDAGESAAAVAATLAECGERGLRSSVVRVGKLKGGGPGKDTAGAAVTLNSFFYDTNPDLMGYMGDSYADGYLLGLTAERGDKPANFFQKIAAGQASGRAAGVTSRVTAANALVAALAVGGVDVTLTVEEGTPAAMVADWPAFFAEADAAGAAAVSGPIN